MASGRFNAHGVSAVYLAFDYDTALAEYYGSDPARPVVLLPVIVAAKDVIEITPNLGNWPLVWRDWDCDWKLARDQVAAGVPHVTCSSWECGADALRRECSGIIFPSQRPQGGKNLVIFTEDTALGKVQMTVQDPHEEIIKANPAKGRRGKPR
jgi:RES domain-containing protein